MMYGMQSMSQTSSHCGHFAAAAFCARIRILLGTVMLAVSILLACVLPLIMAVS